MFKNKEPKTLEEKLKVLFLINAAERYNILTKAADQTNLSYEKFLEQLIDEELAAKQQRTLKKRVWEAKFPSLNTLDQYDFTWPQKINKK